jgi:hypothetical protein
MPWGDSRTAWGDACGINRDERTTGGVCGAMLDPVSTMSRGAGCRWYARRGLRPSGGKGEGARTTGSARRGRLRVTRGKGSMALRAGDGIGEDTDGDGVVGGRSPRTAWLIAREVPLPLRGRVIDGIGFDGLAPVATTRRSFGAKRGSTRSRGTDPTGTVGPPKNAIIRGAGSGTDGDRRSTQEHDHPRSRMIVAQHDRGTAAGADADRTYVGCGRR